MRSTLLIWDGHVVGCCETTSARYMYYIGLCNKLFGFFLKFLASEITVWRNLFSWFFFFESITFMVFQLYNTFVSISLFGLCCNLCRLSNFFIQFSYIHVFILKWLSESNHFLSKILEIIWYISIEHKSLRLKSAPNWAADFVSIV